VPVEEVRRDGDHRLGRHVEAADDIVLDGLPLEGPNRWEQTHRFADDHRRVPQLRRVLGNWSRISYPFPYVVPEPPLDLGILGEKIERPRQRIGRGLVSSHHERHHLVAELLIGHAAPVLRRRHQEREEVVRVGVLASSPRVDDPEDERVEGLQRSLEAKVLPAGYPLRRLDDRFRIVIGVADRDPQRLSDRIGLGADGGTEERAGDDAKGQLHHLGVHIDDLADTLVPLGQHRVGLLDHRGNERRDAIAMKRRLRQLPLPTPELPFTGDQPFAQNELEALVVGALRVVSVVVDEDVVNGLHVVDEEVPGMRKLQADHVALRGDLREQIDRTSSKLEQVPHERQPGTLGRATRDDRFAGNCGHENVPLRDNGADRNVRQSSRLVESEGILMFCQPTLEEKP